MLRVVKGAKLELGGPVEAMFQCARQLQEMGHSTEILSMDAPGDPGISDTVFKVHAMGPAKTSFGFSPRTAPWLEAHIADYDVVIVHGVWLHHGWVVRNAARKHKVPYFVYTHGSLDPYIRRAYPIKAVKKQVYWPFETRVLHDAQAVLFTTEEERLTSRQSYKPYKVVERVVPYGTSAPVFTESQIDKFYEIVPKARNKRVILCVGRFHPIKGMDLLMEAFGRVFAKDSNWILVVAGPDECGLKAGFEQIAQTYGVADRVFFPGMIKGEAKWGAFRAATVFALPSHHENFGIAVAEALSCGTPVLVSDKVNIWREVTASRAGLVAPDTLDGAVLLLKELKGLSPEDLTDMGKRATDCFVSHFEATRMAAGLLEVIAELGSR
ncbi:MAG: glycosyltransferase [Fimbriimonas sp.]|nr:glycosyltransferase [Fimbriimonas sp.]